MSFFFYIFFNIYPKGKEEVNKDWGAQSRKRKVYEIYPNPRTGHPDFDGKIATDTES